TPVAWNTRHSHSSLSWAAILCTAGVVTPNMVMPIEGNALAPLRDLSLLSSRRALTMPISALAPLASTAREIELRPCTSATEYIMVMSAGPTYGPTSPDATEEIMTFGTPTGRVRMPGATSEAAPEPPAEMTP